MKKFLLFAAAATMAATAMAEVFPQAAELNGEDITPAGYKFNTYNKEFVGYTIGPGHKNWNMEANWYRDNYVANDKGVEDGVVFVLGPAYNNNPGGIANLTNATKIIDMGGTCGKVYCLNFAGSNFPAKYKELTGSDLEIGELPGSYPLLFWHFDHNQVAKYVGQKKDDADYMPLRVRVEMNMFANVQSSEGEYWKMYVNDDQNNVRPAGYDDNSAPDILVNPSEFAYRNCDFPEEITDYLNEVAGGIPEGYDPNEDATVYIGMDPDNQNPNGIWNPNRWLVYEWDINVADRESEDELFKTNIKIKNEIPGGNIGNFTLLVRNIQIYVPNEEDREYVYKKRLRTWNTYTVGAPAGIDEIVTNNENAPAVYYNLQGVRVANPENGIYIVRRGSKVTKELVK